MAPRHRNMGWRKPVPRLSPDSPTTSARALRRLSLTIINKEMPPLPPDWRETMEHAIKKERRQAVYVSSEPPPPPPKDYALSHAGSRRESAITLVDEQDLTFPVPPPHTDAEPIECVERTQVQQHATPVITKRASQKSLPKIYRPPTPPLPAQHPRLRSAGHSRESSESQANTLYSLGQLLVEQRDATPCPSVLPGRLAPETLSATLHESRSHVLTLSGNDLAKRGSASPRVSRQSATSTSTSTGNRSSLGRSQSTCHKCYSVWCALKTLGLHLRAKMAQSAKH
ncbi:hypothetical protein C8Q74DRAFT_819509 [Fomes fomentarius]|nr:hypothetical protein C8Q74DRAFT_819509 [Fomes fomentarius]